MITLPLEEYIELREKSGETSTSTSSTSTGFLGMPAREQTGDEEDAAFERPTTIEPPATQPLTPDLDGEQRDASTNPSCTTPNAADECSWFDPDPHFNKLALASATTQPYGTGLPGSASIDTPPIRSARRSSPRPASIQAQRRAHRRLSRRSILLAPAAVALAALAILLERPSHTIATGSKPAAAVVRAPGLPIFQQMFAPISAEIAALANRATSTGAPRSARQRSARHTQHRAKPHSRSLPRVNDTNLSTAQTSQAAPIAVAPAAPPSAAISSTPTRTSAAPTSNYSGTPAHSSPPASSSSSSSSTGAAATKSSTTSTKNTTPGPTGLGEAVGSNCNPSCS